MKHTAPDGHRYASGAWANDNRKPARPYLLTSEPLWIVAIAVLIALAVARMVFDAAMSNAAWDDVNFDAMAAQHYDVRVTK